MQELLDNDNLLMYLTHNEGKSVIAERFIKTLKVKIYKQMTANNSKSYFAYLNKLEDQYNFTYHHAITKIPINADYSVLTEKIEANPKVPKFKNWSREMFLMDSVLKTNP